MLDFRYHKRSLNKPHSAKDGKSIVLLHKKHMRKFEIDNDVEIKNKSVKFFKKSWKLFFYAESSYTELENGQCGRFHLTCLRTMKYWFFQDQPRVPRSVGGGVLFIVICFVLVLFMHHMFCFSFINAPSVIIRIFGFNCLSTCFMLSITPEFPKNSWKCL